MTRPKTDPKMLKTLSRELCNWCNENAIECVQCSEYQWNVKVPQVNTLLSVYPGSGVIWVPYAHYTNRKTINQSNTKRYFTDKKTLIKQLHEVIFAADKV